MLAWLGGQRRRIGVHRPKQQRFQNQTKGWELQPAQLSVPNKKRKAPDEPPGEHTRQDHTLKEAAEVPKQRLASGGYAGMQHRPLNSHSCTEVTWSGAASPNIPASGRAVTSPNSRHVAAQGTPSNHQEHLPQSAHQLSPNAPAQCGIRSSLPGNATHSFKPLATTDWLQFLAEQDNPQAVHHGAVKASKPSTHIQTAMMHTTTNTEERSSLHTPGQRHASNSTAFTKVDDTVCQACAPSAVTQVSVSQPRDQAETSAAHPTSTTNTQPRQQLRNATKQVSPLQCTRTRGNRARSTTYDMLMVGPVQGQQGVTAIRSDNQRQCSQKQKEANAFTKAVSHTKQEGRLSTEDTETRCKQRSTNTPQSHHGHQQKTTLAKVHSHSLDLYFIQHQPYRRHNVA